MQRFNLSRSPKPPSTLLPALALRNRSLGEGGPANAGQRSGPLTIAISNRQRAQKIALPLLKYITAAALDALEIKQAELDVVLVGANDMAALNEKFLGHEGPTDVITFNYLENLQNSKSRIQNQRLHGEIVICVEEAKRQAKQFGTTWQSEMVRYVVHGILHLLGHDDLRPAARKKMKRAEERLVPELSRRFALSRL